MSALLNTLDRHPVCHGIAGSLTGLGAAAFSWLAQVEPILKSLSLLIGIAAAILSIVVSVRALLRQARERKRLEAFVEEHGLNSHPDFLP